MTKKEKELEIMYTIMEEINKKDILEKSIADKAIQEYYHPKKYYQKRIIIDFTSSHKEYLDIFINHTIPDLKIILEQRDNQGVEFKVTKENSEIQKIKRITSEDIKRYIKEKKNGK